MHKTPSRRSSPIGDFFFLIIDKSASTKPCTILPAVPQSVPETVTIYFTPVNIDTPVPWPQSFDDD